jgi:hypothetical protein
MKDQRICRYKNEVYRDNYWQGTPDVSQKDFDVGYRIGLAANLGRMHEQTGEPTWARAPASPGSHGSDQTDVSDAQADGSTHYDRQAHYAVGSLADKGISTLAVYRGPSQRHGARQRGELR